MTSLTDTLCLQCGLCCNGVLFADVRREGDDSSPLFLQHGKRVAQPCPAFDSSDCKCALYTERPVRCRKFECKQLIAVRAEKISAAAALKQIRAAKKLAARVNVLLAELGDDKIDLPLSKRFQRLQRTAERGGLPSEQFDTLAELQLAVHQLTLLLAQEFYA